MWPRRKKKAEKPLTARELTDHQARVNTTLLRRIWQVVSETGDAPEGEGQAVDDLRDPWPPEKKEDP